MLWLFRKFEGLGYFDGAILMGLYHGAILMGLFCGLALLWVSYFDRAILSWAIFTGHLI